MRRPPPFSSPSGWSALLNLGDFPFNGVSHSIQNLQRPAICIVAFHRYSGLGLTRPSRSQSRQRPTLLADGTGAPRSALEISQGPSALVASAPDLGCFCLSRVYFKLFSLPFFRVHIVEPFTLAGRVPHVWPPLSLVNSVGAGWSNNQRSSTMTGRYRRRLPTLMTKSLLVKPRLSRNPHRQSNSLPNL